MKTNRAAKAIDKVHEAFAAQLQGVYGALVAQAARIDALEKRIDQLEGGPPKNLAADPL